MPASDIDPVKTIATITCLGALALAAASQGAPVYSGKYSGKSRGARVGISVSNDLKANVRYALKTECGRTKGSIDLGGARNGAFSGRRVSRGPQGTIRKTVIKLVVAADGEALAARVDDSLKGGDSKLSGCKARRKLTAKLGKTDAFVASRDAGHYVGTSSGGRPISFDVIVADGKARIENLSADILADCVDDSAIEPSEVPMVVHLAGLSGSVKADGEFYIVHAPDEDTDNDVFGKIGGGGATLEGAVSGLFGPDGLSNPAGPFSCDSWGETFKAARV